MTQDRQRSYAVKNGWNLEFDVEIGYCLSFSPIKGDIRFGKTGE